MTTDSLACSPCSETLATIDWDWTATATRTGESRGRCAGLRYSRTGSRSLSHQSLPCPPPPPLSAANLTARLSVSPVQIPDKIPKNEYFSCHHCHQKVDASRYTGARPPLPPPPPPPLLFLFRFLFCLSLPLPPPSPPPPPPMPLLFPAPTPVYPTLVPRLLSLAHARSRARGQWGAALTCRMGWMSSALVKVHAESRPRRPLRHSSLPRNACRFLRR